VERALLPACLQRQKASGQEYPLHTTQGLGVIKGESNAQSGPMVYPIEAPTRITLLELKTLVLLMML
jgi:hypothetical protein